VLLVVVVLLLEVVVVADEVVLEASELSTSLPVESLAPHPASPSTKAAPATAVMIFDMLPPSLKERNATPTADSSGSEAGS
jgi:hypothetical protein